MEKTLPKKLNDLGLESFESFANFVLVKVDPKNFLKNIYSNSLKKKILVRDLHNYGLLDFFRVSIGASSDLIKFLKVLKLILKKK